MSKRELIDGIAEASPAYSTETSKLIEKLNDQLLASTRTTPLQKEMARLSNIIVERTAKQECSCDETTEYLRLKIISDWYFDLKDQEHEMKTMTYPKCLCTVCDIERLKQQDEDFHFPRRGTR